MVSSLGRVVVADLSMALGEHAYMLTPTATALVDRYTDITVDHLNAIRAKSVTVERPDGLSGLALFAAARPTRRANKSQRITDVLRDLPAFPHLLGRMRIKIYARSKPPATKAAKWRIGPFSLARPRRERKCCSPAERHRSR